ncbi:hypothetical protein H5410_022793 [Solanum commersonii]|uniref:Uncharacterized protein n=1 Tax=Solanum commersonii TaxID=4109 RepID=A0A9J5ZI54_SOLCO|nr:hypothetical protein H5410_022793 [Solanum commersonii]
MGMETFKDTFGMVVSYGWMLHKSRNFNMDKGWLETEEETSLKNHLKWARLKIKGDGGTVLKEVKIVAKDLAYFISIWPEVQLKVVLQKTKKATNKDHWIIDGKGEKSVILSLIRSKLNTWDLGPNYDEAQFLEFKKSKDKDKTKVDPMLVEIETNSTDSTFFDSENDDLYANPSTESQPKYIAKLTRMEEEEDYVDVVTIIEEEKDLEFDTLCSNMQLVNCNEEDFCNCDEAEPLNFQSVEEESDREMDVSLWVHQNIIKLSKEFGVEFEGCRKEALALFKKIDSRRHSRNIKTERKTGESTKVKGI